MASEDIILSAPSPTHSMGVPERVQDTNPSLDTEMTSSLTSHDDGSIKSNSPSPGTQDKMSFRGGFQANNGSRTGRANTFSGAVQYHPEFGITSNGYGNVGPGGPPYAPNFNNGGGYDPTSPSMGSSPPAFRPRAGSLVGPPVPLGAVAPGPAWPTENQLNVAYGYGIRRDSGSYTRLVPADQIQDYVGRNLPVNQGPEGLIILPLPRQLEPGNRSGPEQLVPHEVVRSLPYLNAPPPATYGTQVVPYDEVQATINTIVAQNSVSPPRRREKIYCDKWIHEGTCAFTQMGCKYKHEMPMDKATQMTLGLNHGLPNWYRRAYGVNLHNEPSSPPLSSPTSKRMDAPWRPLGAPPSRRNDNGGAKVNSDGNDRGRGRASSSASGSERVGSRNFGPVGSPPPRSSFNVGSPNARSFNPYNQLKIEEEDDDEEDDTVTFAGRGRKYTN